MVRSPAPRHPRRRSSRGQLPPVGLSVALVALLTGAIAIVASRWPDREPEEAVTAAGAAGLAAVPSSDCEAGSLPLRAGLVLVVGLPHVTDADHPLVDRLASVGVGGVMLRDENFVDVEQAEELVDDLRDRLGEHLLVAVDEEGGRVTSLRALDHVTPSARRLGVAGPEAAAEAGAELAEVLREIGVDWVFAPVVDLDDGPFDGVIGDRSFGADPDTVTETAGAFADELRDAGIAVTVKHFPGHGGEGDPHVEMTSDPSTRGTLLSEDVVAFDALIADGAETVMVGHVSYPRVWGTLPASLEPGAYELLRSRGFEGLAVTDALGMGAVHARWGFLDAPAMAIAAGADAALVNQGERAEELLLGLVAAVERGDLSEERLDEAVGRVLDLRGEDHAGILCRET